MAETAAQKKAKGSQPDDEGAAAKAATQQTGDEMQNRTEDQLETNTGNKTGAQAGGRAPAAKAKDFGARASKARAAKEAEEGEYVVLFDHYAWLENDPETGEQQRHDGLFRQRVYLSAKEAARGLRLGAIAKPEDVGQVLAARRARPSDATIQNMSPEQVTAYLVQNAEDAARVYKLERDRDDGGRPEVLDATGDLDMVD